MKLDQLGSRVQLAADSLIVLVRLAGETVGPRKTATDSRIVGLVMDRARAVAQQSASSLFDARSPLAPTRPVNKPGPVIGFDLLRLVF